MRKNSHSHTLRDGTSGSTSLDMSANITTEPTNVQYSDNVGLFFTWTGSSPIGTVYVDVSNDKVSGDNEPTNWATLDFGSTVGITGNADTGLININQVPFSWLRVRYTRTSGSGTLTINLTTKQTGA
jgi:hypothetical protein